MFKSQSRHLPENDRVSGKPDQNGTTTLIQVSADRSPNQPEVEELRSDECKPHDNQYGEDKTFLPGSWWNIDRHKREEAEKGDGQHGHEDKRKTAGGRPVHLTCEAPLHGEACFVAKPSICAVSYYADNQHENCRND
jgi:hypothetical protein